MFQADLAHCPNLDRDFLTSMRWPAPRLIDMVLSKLPVGSLPDDPRERQRWLLYALLQHTADAQKLDMHAWANEDRINEYLDYIDSGNLPSDLLGLRVWLKHAPGNRCQKYARRYRLIERYRNDLVRSEIPCPEGDPERTDELARELANVRRLTSDREWHFLKRAATESLESIAESENLPLGTVKSILSRCRARLRSALIGVA